LPKIRVLIVDDHTLFLEGLKAILTIKYPILEVVEAVPSGLEALRVVRENRVDVVLLDMKMPDMNGAETAHLILKISPSTKIIMLTTFDDRELINEALKAGAAGYILKDVPPDELVQIIRSVNKGNIIMSPNIAEKLKSGVDDESPSPEEHKMEALRQMNKSQREILFQMSIGKSNDTIAHALNLSEKTVRNYITDIYDILAVHNRTQAVLWAVNNNIRDK